MSTVDNDNDEHGGSGEKTSSKKECTSCEQNNFDNITEGIDTIAIAIQKDMSTCAACGKEGNSADMNTCNKCKSVKYCNAACKKKHRTKHKQACERRVAELYDEQLFKKPPPPEECPICMLPMPLEAGQTEFKLCCGKVICHGCIYAIGTSEGGGDLCAFCRTPLITDDKERYRRTKKLIDKGNATAMNMLANCFAQGRMGLPQNRVKANELCLKAGELGHALGYYNLGNNYREGKGVEMDKTKAKHYYELAAMDGNVSARHNLGLLEGAAGNYHRAMKHFIIAAKAGHDGSLDYTKRGYKGGLIAKDEYADILRAYQARQEEMKSDEREEAAKAIAAIRCRGFMS